MSIDPRTVTSADLANPAIDALTLHSIAQARPDLWPWVVQHPNTYQALNQWIAQQQVAPPVTDATQQPLSYAALPQPAAYTPIVPQQGYPEVYPQAYPQPAPQQAYPQPYPQPAPQSYPAAAGAYRPRKAKGSAFGPILMFVASLLFLVAAGAPAASSPRGSSALVDLDVPFTYFSFAWMALFVSSIVVWVMRTRGAMLTGAIFGFICGGTVALIGIANAIAAASAGWTLQSGFFLLAAAGLVAIVGAVLTLRKRPKTTYA